MIKKNTFHMLLALVVLLASNLACNVRSTTSSEPDVKETDSSGSESPGREVIPTQERIDPKDDTLDNEEIKFEEPEMEVIRQWAIFAYASSEYSNPDWAAFQATGAPESTECEDAKNAWASAQSTTIEWLELLYEIPVYPDQINIFQNNLPDQVVSVELIDPDLNYHVVYTGEPSIQECPYTLSIDVSNIDFLITGVKSTIDQSILNSSWDEIDAVELVGRYPGEVSVSEVAPTSSPVELNSEQSSDYTLPDINPSSLVPGTFFYEVAGASEDAIIDKGTIQDQSTSEEYVLGFVSQNFRYAVSLFIPLNATPGTLNFGKYDRSAFSKGPNAAIYIGSGYYYADGGTILIESVERNLITGKFVFNGTSEYDESRNVTVFGVFNQYPLPNK